MMEEILGRFKDIELPGFAVRSYNLIFTDKRIIGQHTGGGGYALGGAISSGSVGAVMDDSVGIEKTLKKTKTKDPEEIFSSDDRNFAINYEDIDKVILRKTRMKLKLNRKQRKIGKKPTFCFSHRQFRDIESLLMKMISAKVEIR